MLVTEGEREREGEKLPGCCHGDRPGVGGELKVSGREVLAAAPTVVDVATETRRVLRHLDNYIISVSIFRQQTPHKTYI